MDKLVLPQVTSEDKGSILSAPLGDFKFTSIDPQAIYKHPLYNKLSDAAKEEFNKVIKKHNDQAKTLREKWATTKEERVRRMGYPGYNELGENKESFNKFQTETLSKVSAGKKLDFFDRLKMVGDDPSKLAPFVGSAVEMNNLISTMQAAYDYQNGNANDEQIALLRQFAYKTQVENAKTDFGYKVINILAGIPSFAGEMAATAGIGSIVKKGVYEGGLKILKKIADKKLTQFALKGVGTAIGALAETPVQASFKIGAESIQRMMPEVKLDPTQEEWIGEIINSNEQAIPAVLKSAGGAYIDILAQRTAGMWSHLGNAAKNAALKLAWVRSFLKVNPNASVYVANKLIQRTGWSGLIPQMFVTEEQRAGRNLIEGTKYQLQTPEDYMAELVAFSVPAIGEYAARKYEVAGHHKEVINQISGQNTEAAFHSEGPPDLKEFKPQETGIDPNERLPIRDEDIQNIESSEEVQARNKNAYRESLVDKTVEIFKHRRSVENNSHGMIDQLNVLLTRVPPADKESLVANYRNRIQRYRDAGDNKLADSMEIALNTVTKTETVPQIKKQDSLHEIIRNVPGGNEFLTDLRGMYEKGKINADGYNKAMQDFVSRLSTGTEGKLGTVPQIEAKKEEKVEPKPNEDKKDIDILTKTVSEIPGGKEQLKGLHQKVKTSGKMKPEDFKKGLIDILDKTTKTTVEKNANPEPLSTEEGDFTKTRFKELWDKAGKEDLSKLEQFEYTAIESSKELAKNGKNAEARQMLDIARKLSQKDQKTVDLAQMFQKKFGEDFAEPEKVIKFFTEPRDLKAMAEKPSSVQALKKLPEKEPGKTLTDEDVKQSDLIKFLSKKLMVPVDFWRNKRSAGEYWKTGNVKISEGKARTAFHEIGGHYILDKFKDFRDVVRKNRETLRDFDYENATREDQIRQLGLKIEAEIKAGKDVSKLEKSLEDIRNISAEEGFGEFVRIWMEGESDMRNKLVEKSSFMKDFRKFLVEHPEEAKILETVKEMYASHWNAGPVGRIASNISFKAEQVNKMPTFKSIGDWLAYNFYTSRFYIEQLENVMKKNGIELTPQEKSSVLLANYVGKKYGEPEHWIEHAQLNVNGQKIGPSLKEILSPVSKNLELQKTLSTYLAALRAKELSERTQTKQSFDYETGEIKEEVIPTPVDTGIDIRSAKRTIDEIESKHPEFKQIADNVYKYTRNILDFAVDTGVLSREEADAFVNKNKYYVPFFRDVKDTRGRTHSMQDMSISNPFRAIKGGELDIIDPIENLIAYTYKVVQSGIKNQIKQKFRDTLLSRKEFQSLFRQSGIASKEKIDALVDRLDNEDFQDDLQKDVYKKFSIRDFDERNEEMIIMDNGKASTYKINPELRKSFEALDSETIPTVIEIISLPTRILKACATTLFLPFTIGNIIRDQQDAMIYSNPIKGKKGYSPLIDLPRGIKSVIKKDEAYWEAKRGGLFYGTFTTEQTSPKFQSTSQNAFLRRLQNDKMKQRLLNDKTSPLQFLFDIAEAVEMSTRMGEFIRNRKAGKSIEESTYAGRNITLDFSKMGVAMKMLNRIIPFINPAIQGDIRTITGGSTPLFEVRGKTHYLTDFGKAYFLRIITNLVAPSIILATLNSKSKDVKEIKDSVRYSNWIIPLGTGPNGEPITFQIPKPQSVSMFANATEAVMDAIGQNDPEILKRVLESSKQSLQFNMMPTVMQGPVEMAANYSMFRGGPIENPYMEKLLPELRYSQNTSDTAKAIGRLIHVSPAKLDYFVSSQFAGIGRALFGMTDMLISGEILNDKLPESQQIPIFKKFLMKEPIGSLSKSVDTFYSHYKELSQAKLSYDSYVAKGDKRGADGVFRRYPELRFFSAAESYADGITSAAGELKQAIDSPLQRDEKIKMIRMAGIKMRDMARQANKELKWF